MSSYFILVELKKKITTVRHGLSKEIRVEAKASRSGSGRRTTKVYMYTTQLSFLRPYLKLRALQDNMKRKVTC